MKTNLTLNDAKKALLSIIEPIKTAQIIPLEMALGKVCASAIICQKNLPSYNNAALDGFAFKYKEDLDELEIVATIYAGDIQEPILKENQCYKIMTGAKVPEDADTIVPFEAAVKYTNTHVTLPKGVKKGNAFRLKGEEQKKGNVLFPKGVKIKSSHIAMLAAQGITHIEVISTPKIAIASTGDELKEPWQISSEDEIYNANAFGVGAILESYGFKSEYVGVIPDDLEASKKFIGNLLDYDLLITSGGVSMGEADYVQASLESHGFKPIFHGINLKPGRPTMAGKMGKTLVIALPGNPMAAYLNAFLLAIPALKALQHQKDDALSIHAINQTPFTCKGNRNELVLGHYEDGKFYVTRNNKYGSGMITPLLESNALFIASLETKNVEKDASIKITLLP
jgi:molybdopterin molybdotransferase